VNTQEYGNPLLFFHSAARTGAHEQNIYIEETWKGFMKKKRCFKKPCKKNNVQYVWVRSVLAVCLGVGSARWADSTSCGSSG